MIQTAGDHAPVFGYAGQYVHTGGASDPEAGLLYYRARYYDPKAGRFIGEDPIRFWSGINFDSYFGNNPIGWIDPFGLDRLEYQNGQISWVTDAGTTVGTYAGVSGPWGKGPLPLGTYTGDNLRTRTMNGMTCPGNQPAGWSLDLEPQFGTDRTDLRIHPDGNVPGTEGCIGASCADATRLYNDLKNWFTSGNTAIDVLVLTR